MQAPTFRRKPGHALVGIVRPTVIAPASRDPDDDQVLACALAAGAGLIVSRDKDLLDLGTFEGIRILSAALALATFAARSGEDRTPRRGHMGAKKRCATGHHGLQARMRCHKMRTGAKRLASRIVGCAHRRADPDTIRSEATTRSERN